MDARLQAGLLALITHPEQASPVMQHEVAQRHLYRLLRQAWRHQHDLQTWQALFGLIGTHPRHLDVIGHLVEHMLRVDPGSPVGWRCATYLARAAGDKRRFVRTTIELVRRTDAPMDWAQLVEGLLGLGRQSWARAALDRAVQTMPPEAFFDSAYQGHWQTLGDLALLLGDVKAAEGMYGRAVLLAPHIDYNWAQLEATWRVGGQSRFAVHPPVGAAGRGHR